MHIGILREFIADTLPRRAVQALMAALALALMAAPAAARVIGKDDRLMGFPHAFASAEKSLGIVSISGTGGCTAFCVAPDVVATSAHCLLKQDGSWRQKSLFFLFSQFSLGRAKTSFMAGNDPQSNRLNVVLGTRQQKLNGGRWLPTRVDDWALLRFDRSPCKSTLPLASLRNLPKATKGARIGMPSLLYLSAHSAANRKPSRLFSRKCRFLSRVPGMPSRYQRGFQRRVRGWAQPVHSCDAQDGQSGSPILRLTAAGRLEVLAIHSGSSNWCVTRGKRRRCYPFNVAASVASLAKSLKRFRTERVVDEESIKQIQKALRRRKLYRSAIDGIFGRGTRRAIERYERSVRWARLGLPTAELMIKLGLTPPKKAPAKTPEPAPEPERVAEPTPQPAVTTPPAVGKVSPGKLYSGSYATVIGEDERTPVLPKALASAGAAVGMLEDRFGFCNAFCVAENVIATSASCLIDDQGQWKNWSNFFRFVRWSGNRQGWSYITGRNYRTREQNIVLGRRIRPRTATGIELSARDWALMRIAKGVCGKPLRIAGDQNGAKDKPTGLISYLAWSESDREQKKQRPVFSAGCGLVETIPGPAKSVQEAAQSLLPKDGLLLHTCDVQTNQAGSPIVQALPGGDVAALALSTGHYVLRRLAPGRKIVAHKVNTAVPITALAPSLKRFQSEKVLGYADITRIQKALHKRKLHYGKTGGVFDMATREAILRFEKEQNLPPLGLPTGRILERLGLKPEAGG